MLLNGEMMSFIKIFFINLLIAVIVLGGCSSTKQVSASNNDGKIIIDGNQSDWGRMTAIDGENIAFGFSNDKDNLYISMITNDRAKIMKILRGGLDVWFEGENSGNKIGIRYPEKPDPSEFQFNPSAQQPPDVQNFDLDNMVYQVLSKQNELYILNEDEKVIKSYPINGETFKARIKIDKGTLCYEIKIPIGKSLSKTEGIRTDNSSKVIIEFVSGKIKFASNKEKPDMDRENMPPSGPQPGGGFPGGGRGKPDMNRSESIDTSPLSYSFEILLAQ